MDCRTSESPLRATLEEKFNINTMALPKQDTELEAREHLAHKTGKILKHDAASFKQLALYLPVEVDCWYSQVFGKLILPWRC